MRIYLRNLPLPSLFSFPFLPVRLSNRPAPSEILFFQIMVWSSPAGDHGYEHPFPSAFLPRVVGGKTIRTVPTTSSATYEVGLDRALPEAATCRETICPALLIVMPDIGTG